MSATFRERVTLALLRRVEALLDRPYWWARKRWEKLDEAIRVRDALKPGTLVRCHCDCEPNPSCEANKQGEWEIERYNADANDYRIVRPGQRNRWEREQKLPETTFMPREGLEVLT